MLSDDFQRQAVSTRRRHIVILNVLREVAGPGTPVARLDSEVIDNVLADRRANGLTERTMNGYKTTLRLLGRWLVMRRLVAVDPSMHLRNVKATTPRSKRKPINADQVRHMIKLADEKHPVDAATVALLVFTGCRSVEIIGLRWRDVDLDAGTLTVFRSKVQDWHTVPMNPALTEHLTAWKAWVREHHGEVKGAWYVVPARAHRGFTPERVPFRMSRDWPLNPTKPQHNLGERVKGLLRRVGEADVEGRGAHTLRRTAANLILNATGDVRAAQTLLGHSSLLVTEKYLDIDARAEKYNPMIRNWTI